MKKRRLGYARVSTKDQTLERQIKVLVEAGVSKDNIYLFAFINVILKSQI